jgi:dTDP-4-amino-4,6-dideoxygalactose transaminase
MAAHHELAHRDEPIRRPLPRTDNAEAQTLLLPMFTDLDRDDQDYVIRELRAALEVSLGDAGPTVGVARP